MCAGSLCSSAGRKLGLADESMAQPGGNVTGFTQFEYSLAGKWLELLKEIAPNLSRVAVLRDATRGPGIGQFAVIQAMAPPHRVELRPNQCRRSGRNGARDRSICTLPECRTDVTVGGTAVRRDLIIAAAAKYRLPAVYPYRLLLQRWRSDLVWAQIRSSHTCGAVGYVDRIFKGEKPANLARAGADKVPAGG